MLGLTVGHRGGEPHRCQCHDLYRHASFGYAVPVCCMNWHIGAALRPICLVLCEHTKAENWRAFVAGVMRSLCVRRAGIAACSAL